MPQRILVMIPCYNEESSIGPLLREIQELDVHYDTLVIDDGSQDNTYSTASKLSSCLRLVANIGIGGCVQTAIKYAFLNDYDLAIQVDGDGQHPPSQIHTLINDYTKSPSNLIIGSRFLLKERFQSTLMRRIGISAISCIIKWLFGKKITDPTSGLRLMDREAIKLFSSEYPHDFPEPISVGFALERGLTIREVPIAMRTREHGTSSISGIKTIAYMLRVIGYLILIRIGRHL
ncbi:TPA: glycosyltransferase family 2 protein [bacterium]|nr:glycosyltransferase family 2 protein [bacterium]